MAETFFSAASPLSTYQSPQSAYSLQHMSRIRLRVGTTNKLKNKLKALAELACLYLTVPWIRVSLVAYD